MALIPIPDDFGQGGANIGDGEVRLIDILKNHHDEIQAVESGSVDTTARAAAAAAQSTANSAATVAAAAAVAADLASVATNKGAHLIGLDSASHMWFFSSTNMSDVIGEISSRFGTDEDLITTAQTTANNAASAATSAASAASAAATAASAAQSTADGAVATNVTQNSRLDALEAGSGAVFADEIFRARAKSLAGITAPARFFFSDDLELNNFKFYQGGTSGNENPSVVRLEDNSSTTPNNVYPAGAGAVTAIGCRAGKWFISATARFFGTIGVGSGEWRALVGTDHQDTFSSHFGVGVFEAVSSTHFAFFTTGDAGDKSAVSTVAFSAGTHKLELWYDGTNYFFAIDEETPIQLTGITPTDFPDSGMTILFTNKDATQPTWPDAIGWAQTRINAGP